MGRIAALYGAGASGIGVDGCRHTGAQTHVPDEVFETLRKQFSDEEIAKLTLLVGTINLWNRMAISFRAVHPTNFAKARASG
jgi:hypothetical protein